MVGGLRPRDVDVGKPLQMERTSLDGKRVSAQWGSLVRRSWRLSQSQVREKYLS